MRTLMMIASIAMTGAGIFCVANASAAFLSVAFIIGIVFILLGAFEILVGRRADFDVSETGVGIAKDGFLMLIFGIVIISGQVTDDNSAQVMFALWMLVEGVLAFRSEWLDIMETDADQRIGVTLCTLMLIAGGYMFFNNSTFRLSQTLLIGICMIILGLRRFWQSFSIEYSRPSFVTGNEEKLMEAQEDEKRHPHEDLADDRRRGLAARELSGEGVRPGDARDEEEEREDRVVVAEAVPDDMRHLFGEPTVLCVEKRTERQREA